MCSSDFCCAWAPERAAADQVQVVELHAIWVRLRGVDGDLLSVDIGRHVLNAVLHNLGIPAATSEMVTSRSVLLVFPSVQAGQSNKDRIRTGKNISREPQAGVYVKTTASSALCK